MKKLFFIGISLSFLLVLSPKTFAASSTEENLINLRSKIQTSDTLCSSRKADCLNAINKQINNPNELSSASIKKCIREMKDGYIELLEKKITELKDKIRILEKSKSDTRELKEVVKAAEQKLTDLKML